MDDVAFVAANSGEHRGEQSLFAKFPEIPRTGV